MCKDVHMTQGSPVQIEGVEFAGQLFFRLWRACNTQTAAALRTIGLSPATFAVLNHLRGQNGAIQLQIAMAMRIDPSAMVALVDELEASGLAKRRPHAKDRRAREILITAKGRRVLTRARELAEEVEDDVLRGLAERERLDLVALLRKAIAGAPAQPLWRAEEDG